MDEEIILEAAEPDDTAGQKPKVKKKTRSKMAVDNKAETAQAEKPASAKKKRGKIAISAEEKAEAEKLQAARLVEIDAIRPYERNPRDNRKSIDKVAESIKEFGFLQPIVCDKDGVIIVGHTRYAAAEKLGLSHVPVIYAADLSPEKVKAYRIADNKVGEDSLWDEGLLAIELEDLVIDDFDMTDFGFDDPGSEIKQHSWEHTEKRCGLKKKLAQTSTMDYTYTSFHKEDKDGIPFEEIKTPGYVQMFADNLTDYLTETLGENVKNGDWGIVTTPRRRHKEGFHFATEVCRTAAEELGIQFTEDIVTAKNRDRINPQFTLINDPPEKNIIIYDDIITTGITLRETRKLLIEAGHVVYSVVAIKN